MGPKKLMNAVESITSTKPKNVDSSYVVRTALTLINYPVELLEDRDIQIASDLAKKFMAFSLQGQVDEADITVNHIQGQVGLSCVFSLHMLIAYCSLGDIQKNARYNPPIIVLYIQPS